MALSLLVLAQVGMPAVADAQTAVEANRRGVEAYGEGRFEDAARAFGEAWELSENSSARKNEAIAWFKANRCEPALIAAASFLSYGEGARDEFVEVNSVVANCKTSLMREAISLGDLDLAESFLGDLRFLEVDVYAREQVNLARLEFARAKYQAELPAAAADSERDTRAQSGWRWRSDKPLLGWALVGAGGTTLLATGAYHLSVAIGTVPRFRAEAATGTDRSEYERLSRKVATARWLVPLSYGLGAIAAGTGVYLLMIEPQRGGAVVSVATTF